MTGPDVGAAKAYAFRRLELELPSQLCYHSLYHTRDEVLPAARHLAALAGLDEQATLLLVTAACYHDLGFIVSCDNHEAHSVAIMRTQLPQFGYGEAELEAISGLILATRLPQSPRTALERILADADLSVLGSETFAERNAKLRAEKAALDGPMSDEDWFGLQLQFLSTHRYFTEAARASYDARKQENLELVRAQLAAAHA